MEVMAKETKRVKSARAGKIDQILRKIYTEGTALKYDSVFQLLVATILSAQCTDKMVNEVTRTLFAKFPDPRSIAEAELSVLENEIYSTGYFRQKAKALKGCSTAIMERFGGEVPINMEDMVTLPGVGRKTANLVLGISEGIPGVVVDTHVLRLSKRMGFTESKNPDRVEKDLSQLLQPERWTPFSGLLIGHGRAVCTARKAMCEVCEVNKLCPRVGVN